ncbi:lysosomal acid lipase/cholesteryl ester hydrolase-like [Dermacentor variabilis]|uniref:lysosomal acid lipase/cholesteryl ester hydrolase-like n=1 Tax=Dermacentor variabilis TaxID=34621 RepID=UPI003F5B2F8B
MSVLRAPWRVLRKPIAFLTFFSICILTTYASDVEQQAKMTTCQLITYFGFSCETTAATTDDGYILEVDRVGTCVRDESTTCAKNGTGRNPIILVPGILSESGSWFVNYPSQSPGFLLAQRGYDLWAMNTREIAFRSRHKTLSQNDDRYWQWSFDEIGRYDIAAVIDLVLNVTRASKVTLLAYSQGLTSSLVLLSTRTEYNDKIDLLVAYGPVANITHIGFPIRELITISDPLFLLLDPFGESGYLYLPEAPRGLVELVCGVLQGQPCSLFLSITLLSSPEQLNKTRIPVMLSHYPIGTSYQNLRHFVQINREKDFLMYNYGASKNKDRYGQKDPPPYDVDRITVPIALFSSEGDTVADPKDVSLLTERLGPRLLFNHVVPPKDFRHLDFDAGYKATDFLHKIMIDTIEKYAGTIT